MNATPRKFYASRDDDDPTILVDPAVLLGATSDLTVDACTVSDHIGLVGRLYSVAVARQETADTDYRHWRANAVLKCLDVDPKMAEWKTKAEVEASTGFGVCKARIADATEDVEHLRTMLDGLRVKASMVRARADMHRGAYDSSTNGDAPDRPSRVRNALAPQPDA